jgi:hypothetical protein
MDPIPDPLPVVLGASLGPVRVVERVAHADTLERSLRDPVDHGRLGETGGSRTAGAMSTTWWNCARSSPLAVKPFVQCTVPSRRTPRIRRLQRRDGHIVDVTMAGLGERLHSDPWSSRA